WGPSDFEPFLAPSARWRRRRGEGAPEIAPARLAWRRAGSRWRAAAHRSNRGGGGWPGQPRRLRRSGRRVGHRAIRRPTYRRRHQPGEDAPRHRRSGPACREACGSVSARIIDGKALAASLRARLAERVGALPFHPGLAVVLVGDDPASAIYVRAKDRAANAAGIATQTIRLPADTSEAALLTVIARLNADPAIDGILVQLPLPAHISTPAAIEAVDPDKDVDGFHPLN